MEQLNEELDKLIDKLEHSTDFRNESTADREVGYERLKLRLDSTRDQLDKFSSRFWKLTKQWSVL
jgi:hypothetical protein